VTPSASVPSKPLRLDAERNRAAILEAAAVIYAERGCETSLEEVAKLAGVGVGTVYRRFPNKALLIEALVEGVMREHAEQTEEFAKLVETEPWEAFRKHVLSLVSLQARDRAFSEVISQPASSSETFRAHHSRAFRASLLLTSKARAAGVLRADSHHRDLLILTHAVNGVTAASAPGDTSRSLRLAELFLAGTRAT
jgi:AcrR family transcriptional regulator